MKSMLYVGAALMIGASIYGFVDYRETSRKKEFNDLYAHKETNKPVIIEEKKTVAAEKKLVVPVEKKVSAPVKVSEKKEVDVTKEVKTTTVATDEKKSTEKPVVKKKKKKLNYRDFSRGPLREDREEIVVEPVKEETKKTDNKQKEQ